MTNSKSSLYHTMVSYIDIRTIYIFKFHKDITDIVENVMDEYLTNLQYMFYSVLN